MEMRKGVRVMRMGGFPRVQQVQTRSQSFGEGHRLTLVDRFGIWLSRRQIRRWVPDLSGKVIGDFGCGYQARLARSVLVPVAKAFLADVSLAADPAAEARARAPPGPEPARRPGGSGGASATRRRGATRGGATAAG